MSGADVLALWLADAPDTRGRHEALRVLVAARAAGRRAALLDLRPAAGPPVPDLTDDERRLLESLDEEGVRPSRPSAAMLRSALASAQALVSVADPKRRGTPGLLVIDATWLRTTRDEALLPALQEAGQLVRG